jgi:hypothetical protein
MTLVNAISDRSLGDYEAETYIADKVNPASGTIASKYGEILQTKLERPIMTSGDAAEAESEMRQDGESLIKTLI